MHNLAFLNDEVHLPLPMKSVYLNRFEAYYSPLHLSTTTTTTTVLRPSVWDYLGEPVPEETLTHPPS